VELVKLLLEHNANVNLKSRYGYPLQIAAEMGRKEIVELLLARGAKTDAKNTAGKTAANLADGNGHKDIGDIIRGAEHKSKS
jgi:ankyrin repeat protein